MWDSYPRGKRVEASPASCLELLFRGCLLKPLQRKLWAANYRPWSKSHCPHSDIKLLKKNGKTPSSRRDQSDLLKDRHFSLTRFRGKLNHSLKGEKKNILLYPAGGQRLLPGWLEEVGNEPAPPAEALLGLNGESWHLGLLIPWSKKPLTSSAHCHTYRHSKKKKKFFFLPEKMKLYDFVGKHTANFRCFEMGPALE